MILYLLPLGLQAALMFVDEFVFHRQRGLPRWERLGHPIDTLSVLSCLLVTLVFEPTSALWLYISLSILSCLLITKDEWVHAKHCSPTENWLHSLLFIIHPVVLFCFARLWYLAKVDHLKLAQDILIGSSLLVGAFMLYQLVFWNLIRGETKNV